MTNSLIVVPLVVIRPILLPTCSVNQIAPSGPAAMPEGALLAVGATNSVIEPAVVIRPILLPTFSVNHRLPSGPDAIANGKLPAVGMSYSVTCADAEPGHPEANASTAQRSS